MSRWGKNIVVPLDVLCKEKENTNRPTVARSVGTVGKWGKMGFTSTRTYTLSALPAVVAAAAAAAAASPAQSPASALDDDMSPSVPEPPKPKKFFKSRNAAPPEVIAQIIQQMPHASTSPARDTSASAVTSANAALLNTPVHSREPIKLKLPKSNSAERKKKTPKKVVKQQTMNADDTEDATTPTSTPKPVVEPKSSKKKKEEKKLKPEAPPSRVIARARKVVNYCEDDDDERIPTPIKDIVVPKSKQTKLESNQDTTVIAVENSADNTTHPVLPPPAVPPATSAAGSSGSTPVLAPKTPEHPPIVLRISKGTSRLVSTDSEEQSTNAINSPHRHDNEPSKSRHTSTEEVPSAYSSANVTIHNTPKIIVKPPRPPSADPELPPPPPPNSAQLSQNQHNEEPPEINYSTVKISPDKPPKERLKLIIKTDVIRNAIKAAEAAKAAAAAQKAAAAEAGAVSGAAGFDGERPEREKKQKSKKHKHLKHTAIEQLTPPTIVAAAVVSEFKTPSPHLALGTGTDQQHQHQAALARTIISPPALSERDFDSQSSVLGSISSKGNSTPQPLAQAVHEESCVIHSRGSSVITSDLETSQHSSLVAPPSDIESRLESMMMDGEVSQRPTNLVEEEPLQEDILAVLRGEESISAPVEEVKINGISENVDVNMEIDIDKQPVLNTNKSEELETNQETSSRRVTRGRGRGATTKGNYLEEDSLSPQKNQPSVIPATRTRGRKTAVATTSPAATEEALPTKRTTRGRPRKSAADEAVALSIENNATLTKAIENISEAENTTPTLNESVKSDVPQATVVAPVTRRGRITRNITNNNVNNSNNNNINKIAANLSAKAGAAEEAASKSNTAASPRTGSTPPTTRTYGRKRKNQQVTQVLQPSTEASEDQQQGTPAKLANLDSSGGTSTIDLSPTYKSDTSPRHSVTPTLELQDTNSNSQTRPSSAATSSPPRRDYKVKDKFKRTLTLDNQANCNAVVASPSDETGPEQMPITGNDVGAIEEEQQRGSVKLVISKKKGSIFKSRALVPSDHTEQSTKRHLYKHRWDAEANGATSSDTNTLPTNSAEEPATVSATRTAADAIFDDFSEDLSASAQSCENSPAISRISRVVKSTNAQSGGNNPFDMDIDFPSESVTSVKVDRKAKGFYTVVRNVKSAHQIQEIGEYQEMDDDVEYILDALQPQNPMPTRCLSALQLATKCMNPTFRMHVRAHGIVTKFFKVLSDANNDLSLGLCTSAIMFILSQEGLNMDLDHDALELMMNLLESEGVAAPSDRASYERNKQKVRELCEEIKSQGKATHLNVDALTVGTLAMETLLSLTSKRAGEWFKEELRTLGGLEHIIKTVSDSCRPVIECSNGATYISWTQSLFDNMQTVERCMRVLENVTQLNEENQKYILTYSQGSAVNTLCTLYSLCDREMVRHSTTADSASKDSPSVVMRELLIPLVKVLINLTHTFNPASALGAELLGQRTVVIETSFHLLLQAPNYIPERCVYELSILVLLLLINLTMYTIPNRVAIMKTYAPPEYSSHQHNRVTAVQAVIEYFYKCEELAGVVEKNTDAILDNTDKVKKKQEEVEETVNSLLQNSGHHMEHTIKGSYAGILIGHLITDNEEYENVVRKHLRGNGFKKIVSVLEKYHTFMDLTCSEASAAAHIKSTKKLIDYFRKRDLVYEMNESNDCALPLNLEMHHASTSAAQKVNETSNSGSSQDNGPTIVTTRSGTQRVYKTYSQR